ncbi:valine--tRNA ligase [Rubinisphaera brasiliensis]|uniref:Valine--tRNA ligase n=1 Tax=Rubinisphaera brasiliensis (strain ATCC 49424 / DSM 5305 / JCM 21570 / IAM 15109 / NBRC 103401 / IFAM 1448) TaxID=756272 RepID=F0SSK2_RUBBR|nr:valine--tRNA ligase [Rubinisphaera brasiliensis]ADY60318.1 Valyl-tRNA synthetase [Rubinisphaera brasiliensis DSM 5305]
MIEIPKQYEPKDVQQKWYEFWEQNGYFNANPNPDKKPHVIMIPLPNVTGALHMGHALNGTIQDLLTRWRRMQGYEALWMPGTDHAGIATQAVVERRMFEQEGLTRHDIGREALVNRIWKWKDSYEKRILNQLKQLGASCDWRRTRFTLDDVCSKAVRRTFLKLFEDGKIYRGKRLVNWDTYLQTAVADDEVFTEEVAGHFWTFHYPVVDENGQESGEKMSFSTTRPETMLGDTALCVHPGDDRYTNLVGRQVKIPLNGRLIPIIADALLADKDLGTGCVKVTPAHDPNDYACGLRNQLEMINILNADGTLNENAGKFETLPILEARKQVVAEMDRLGFLEKVEDRPIPLKHSDRSKTPIEPYLSDQWFVKMDELAQLAIDAVDDKRVRFFPQRYTKTYQDWLSEKRDWCISRQLWWGHRIPIWYCETCTKEDLDNAFGDRDDVSYRRDDEDRCWLICAESDLDVDALGEHELIQDEDVLDTWFSSALWPHATLGWPDQTQNPPLNGEAAESNGKNEVLDYFYPGSVLVTSRDIITLWVARMVLTGLYNMGDIPFSHVCIHPKILDGFGRTMSKSKGNGVDPMDLIDRYGTDAVRFTIASFAGETQDVKLPVGYEDPETGEVIPQELEHTEAKPKEGVKPTVHFPKGKRDLQYSSPNYEPDADVPVARMVSERFEYGRNFCNKFWNAARFAMLNLEGYTPGPIQAKELPLEDRWILSRLSRTIDEVTTCLQRYQFDAATRTLRDFVWNEFCDWYLEMIKPRLRSEADKPEAQRVLVGVLDQLLRLLAPFTPFLTEELWQTLGQLAPERGLPLPQTAEPAAIIAAWPTAVLDWQNDAIEARFERLRETVIAVRNVRAVYGIPPGTPLKLLMRANPEIAGDMQTVSGQFDNLSKAVLEAAGADVQRPMGAASFTIGDIDGYVPLEGVIDIEAELTRQQKEADKLRGFIKGHRGKLNNEGFVNRAPADVVNNVRETLANLESQLESTEEVITQLAKMRE